MNEITHEQIFNRLCLVEQKVIEIDTNTKTLVDVTKKLDNFFTVCRWIGHLSVPFLWLAGVVSAITMLYDQFKGK